VGLRAILVLLSGVCTALVAPALPAARTTPSTGPQRALCSSGYVDAVIGGAHKCLRAGEFCASRYEGDYERYGYTCVNGHLRRRSASSPPPSARPGVALPSHTLLLLPRVRTGGCTVRGPLPDRRCSPGAVYSDATLGRICTPGYSARVRNVPESEKAAVYAEYGIPRTHYGRPYEVDHIVSLELGGSNDIANLYPEAASDPSPGFHVKDRLENRLHALVCSGRLGLRAVQRAIASNWVALYRTVFGVSP
jgi:hypothetical protein